MTLSGKTILITGAARRLGKATALYCAEQGADLVVHYHTSEQEAQQTQQEISAMGQKCWLIQADLNDNFATTQIFTEVNEFTHVDVLINNASIFKPIKLMGTNIDDWDEHLRVNLTAPFLLTQAFARQYSGKTAGRVINIVDWRALRPGKDHFPYTISKAALVALTKSSALNLSPHIIVNAIALGAILPPENEEENPNILKPVPMGRWAEMKELLDTIGFLLDGPEYLTGEVVHLDGGRHLV
jgi:NAD(P)-dependent dehydrogenase (short-subunit alcohol dehydrogenase family)